MGNLTRRDLIVLAQARKADARLLLDHARWATAYYLYGLAVELGVKAVIAKRVAAETIPDRNFLDRFYSHKLQELVILAGLREALEAEQGSAQFKANWEIVKDWVVDSRYENTEEAAARLIANAVDHRRTGVFRWLRTHW